MGLLDAISPTPRNRILGLLADATQGVNDFASKPFGYGNPPARMLMGLLGVPSIATTLDRLSYGEPLTNAGKANVPLLKPETADAAMAAAAALPAVSRGALKASDAAVRAITRNPEATATKVMDYAAQMKPASIYENIDAMKSAGYEPGYYRGGPKLTNNKKSGDWYTTVQADAKDYAERFGAKGEVREYALPSRGALSFDRAYVSRLAQDISAQLDKYGDAGAKLAKELSTYGPEDRISGMEAWRGLSKFLGDDAAMDVLSKLGFNQVRGLNGPDYVRVFPQTMVRDAQKAKFDKSKLHINDVLASIGGIGLLGAGNLQGDE